MIKTGGFTDRNGFSVKPGDRVRSTLDGSTGTLEDALQDGDAYVEWDDFVGRPPRCYKWNHLELANPAAARRDVWLNSRATTEEVTAEAINRIKYFEAKIKEYESHNSKRRKAIDELAEAIDKCNDEIRRAQNMITFYQSLHRGEGSNGH